MILSSFKNSNLKRLTTICIGFLSDVEVCANSWGDSVAKRACVRNRADGKGRQILVWDEPDPALWGKTSITLLHEEIHWEITWCQGQGGGCVGHSFIFSLCHYVSLLWMKILQFLLGLCCILLTSTFRPFPCSCFTSLQRNLQQSPLEEVIWAGAGAGELHEPRSERRCVWFQDQLSQQDSRHKIQYSEENNASALSPQHHWETGE